MPGMKIGYARVSTDEQNLDLQRSALEAAGCERVFEDRGISGAESARPGLAAALAALGAGDVLAVWKLDRLGRSLGQLIVMIDGIGKAGAGFQSLSENINTTTAGGRLIFHVMGALPRSKPPPWSRGGALALRAPLPLFLAFGKADKRNKQNRAIGKRKSLSHPSFGEKLCLL